jgi:hypothetical protein
MLLNITFSFMGMAISPSEQAAVDSADTEGAASSDTSGGSDTSGTESTADTGAGLIFKGATFPEDYC